MMIGSSSTSVESTTRPQSAVRALEYSCGGHKCAVSPVDIRPPLSSHRRIVLEAAMVHWNNLSIGARQLLQKFIEGSHYDPADRNLIGLVETGLIEKSADGWQTTLAGRSAYVVRDLRNGPGSGWISNVIGHRWPQGYWIPTERGPS
jgi:hypothetical protein